MRDYSFQLYSSRNFPPLRQTLGMVAELGYRQVEGYGGLFADAAKVEELKSALVESGLSMPTGHFSFDLVRDQPAQAVAIANSLGLSAVFVPSISPETRPSDAAGWAEFGRNLAEAGKPLQDAGLEFGWHNHDFEFAGLGGGDLPLDLILQASDVLRFEIDVAWIQVGGRDPLAWIAKYADRIIAAHIKDIAPAGSAEDEDGWADVGHGIMDWSAIMAALDKTAVKYFVMEHDNPNDDRRFAERSIHAARVF